MLRQFQIYSNMTLGPGRVRIIFPQFQYRSFSRCSARFQLSPFTRRLFNLPTPPRASSQRHDSLDSFVSYAQRTGLPEDSTTYVGTHYEYTVLQSLRRFAFDLHRVGGRDDAGTDLVGTWHLPERDQALRVIVQCKALKTKLGPNLVRELDGAFRHSPVGWRTSDKLGILISPREATKGVRDAISKSSYPLLWMMIERDGVLRQALWNGKAEDIGLAALGVETQYGGHSAQPVLKEISLTWDGEPLPDMDSVEGEMSRIEAQWLATWECKDTSENGKVKLLEKVQAMFPEAVGGMSLAVRARARSS